MLNKIDRASLVREQLLAVLRDELPHAVTTRVTEWEWPRIRCEILAQRSSQKVDKDWPHRV